MGKHTRTQTSKEGTLASCYSLSLGPEEGSRGLRLRPLRRGHWLAMLVPLRGQWGWCESVERLQTGFSLSHRNKLQLPGRRSIAGVTLKNRKQNWNRNEQVPFDSFTLIVTLHRQSLMGSGWQRQKVVFRVPPLLSKAENVFGVERQLLNNSALGERG